MRRHMLELRDLGNNAFLRNILSPEDWAYQPERVNAAASTQKLTHPI